MFSIALDKGPDEWERLSLRAGQAHRVLESLVFWLKADVTWNFVAVDWNGRLRLFALPL